MGFFFPGHPEGFVAPVFLFLGDGEVVCPFVHYLLTAKGGLFSQGGMGGVKHVREEGEEVVVDRNDFTAGGEAFAGGRPR